MPPPNTKVLIVGAGAGGLVLAHALRKNGISFEIFERDSLDHFRAQGWAVALHEYVSLIILVVGIVADLIIRYLPALRATIPEAVKDIQTISVNASLRVYDSIGVVFGAGELLSVGGGVPEGEPGHILRVKRERLREYLWQDLPVQIGKRFTHYAEDKDGVTAHFADGTSVHGSVLVGADGGHSRVRKQLLGREADPAPYVPLLGSGKFPRDVYEPIHNLGTAAVAVGGEGLRIIISLLNVAENKSSAHYYWAVAFRSEQPEKDATWATKASREELYEKALQVTADIPDMFKKMIHNTGADGMMQPPLRFVEFSPPDSFSQSRVTVLGDAAHTMMPFKGAGVNVAIRDACDLANVIRERQDLIEPDGVIATLQDYAGLIIARGQKMVAASHAAGQDMTQHLGGKAN